jgi:hypothetical protein
MMLTECSLHEDATVHLDHLDAQIGIHTIAILHYGAPKQVPEWQH